MGLVGLFGPSNGFGSGFLLPICPCTRRSAPHTPGIVPVNRSLRIYIYAISSLFWLGLFAALMTGALGNVHLQQLAPLFGLAIAVEAIGVRKQDNTIGFSAIASPSSGASCVGCRLPSAPVMS